MIYTKGEYLTVCAFCLNQVVKNKTTQFPYETKHLPSLWSEILVHDFP